MAHSSEWQRKRFEEDLDPAKDFYRLVKNLMTDILSPLVLEMCQIIHFVRPPEAITFVGYLKLEH